MLIGHAPFEGEEQISTFRNIMRGKLILPESMNPSVADLLRRLLDVNESTRLGSGKGGVSDIMAHPWFSGIDFKALYDKKIPAPWVPRFEGEKDAPSKYFDAYDEDEDEGEAEGAEEKKLLTDFFRAWEAIGEGSSSIAASYSEPSSAGIRSASYEI